MGMSLILLVFGQKPKCWTHWNFGQMVALKKKSEDYQSYYRNESVCTSFMVFYLIFAVTFHSKLKYSVAFVCLLQDTDLLCRSFVWCIFMFLVSWLRAPVLRPSFASVKQNTVCYQCAEFIKESDILDTQNIHRSQSITLRHPIQAHCVCLHADGPAHMWWCLSDIDAQVWWRKTKGNSWFHAMRVISLCC